VNETLAKIKRLAVAGELIISEHAYDRLDDADIDAATIERGVATAEPIEDYPDAHRGPSVLVLQSDKRGHAIHVVWGIRKGTDSPAVAITVYRPEPSLWSDDFRKCK
jgi:hypothetical protein